MNDYWNYLAHGELGKERKGHKYYARVAVGRNKLGFTQYRYFYDAREYGAYMTRQKNNRYSPKFEGKKNTTYFVTGKGTSMVALLTKIFSVQKDLVSMPLTISLTKKELRPEPLPRAKPKP